MRYCKKCLMPDTRPGIKFHEDGVCSPCKNYEKQKITNWIERKKDLEKLCEKYRGKNGKEYDCAIAVSGGKDSHFQVYYMKEIMKMNPVLLTVGNIDWTETGKRNLENLSDVFDCDIISLNPNINLSRKMAIKSFKMIGSSTWYTDALIYAFPYRMSMKLDLKLLIYGEDVNYTYGGKYDEEKSSAMLQPLNDVVKPIWKNWFEDGEISEKEMESAKQPSKEECEKNGLEPIYLSYYVPWNSHNNYEVAKKWGFRTLIHEYEREGTLEQYNQIDSISYLLNQYLKYPKYGHASATEMASRWIRYGLVTREEVIKQVEKYDGILDQGIIDKFISFTGMSIRDFWNTIDKWYNRELFYQNDYGVWKPKFKVGKGLVDT